MKKYLVAAVFLITIFSLAPSGASANIYPAVCFPGDLFNSMTGAPCFGNQMVCKTGDLFNILNGTRCPVNSYLTAQAEPIIITNVEYSPAYPKVNELITTRVTILNNSSTDYNIPFQVNVGGTVANVPYLAAGVQRIVTVPNAFSFGTPGTKTLNTIINYPVVSRPGEGNGGDMFTNTLTFTSGSTQSSTKYDMPVTSPTNTNESWAIGDNHVISWNYPDELAGKTVRLSVSLVDLPQTSSWAIYGPQSSSVSLYTPNSGQVAWSLLSQLVPAGGQYAILVSAYDPSTGITHKGLSGPMTVNQTRPLISSIRPSSASAGSSVTIRGSNLAYVHDIQLTGTGNTSYAADNIPVDSGSGDGSRVTFTVPYIIASTGALLPAGTYDVTANSPYLGTSNALPFRITAPTTQCGSIRITYPSVTGSGVWAGGLYTLSWDGFDPCSASQSAMFSIYLVGGPNGSNWSRFLGTVSVYRNSTDVVIPSDVPAGSGYEFQLSGPGVSGDNSNSFSISYR
ncbi:MAG: hypothetical protein PHS53_02365 [Candidatus Pacebacteria bacterium]|nr:hypothetical protein [Candidatus Paceibacterota bacterium]MDD5356970.1 hypothetical protein [Candidatus Paceibacterota bacterium]